ncbi:Enoyl-CoA hydratase [Serinicoccus hydrothermalis]|uniref:Enoyl-CoA hydratase n=1 Tax=Serinicoccus hydrothermalis TaxID=1758689 RepID=A0A1B1NF52_9MICO|nr:enoyl-CoA hydratase-related protein [Serinicoccus hydrothermalis]ANS80064.1 Enoyl-CoA hydratase [Serinicoccus hydrothermalis]
MDANYQAWNEGSVLASEAGRVLTITLNRPERKNAMDPASWDLLFDILRTAEVDPSVRVVVITGAGDAFCAGADISSAPVGHPVTRVSRIARTAAALFGFPKPVIARVDGAAVGAGWNLALCCDFVVASDRSRFSEIFVRRGLSVDFGGSWLLPQLVGLQQAKRLALLGDFVSAAEARELGLVTTVCPAERLDGAVADLAGRLADGPPIAQALNKALLNEGTLSTFEAALAAEVRAQAVNYATADARSAREAFAQKTTPSFSGEWVG